MASIRESRSENPRLKARFDLARAHAQGVEGASGRHRDGRHGQNEKGGAPGWAPLLVSETVSGSGARLCRRAAR